MVKEAIPETGESTLPDRCQCLPFDSVRSIVTQCLRRSTCILGMCFGFFTMSILRRPKAIAPEETMTTRWPSWRSLTAVSTIRVTTDRRGSQVFSSTIELLPVRGLKRQLPILCLARSCVPSLRTMVRRLLPFMLTLGTSKSEGPIPVLLSLTDILLRRPVVQHALKARRIQICVTQTIGCS